MNQMTQAATATNSKEAPKEATKEVKPVSAEAPEGFELVGSSIEVRAWNVNEKDRIVSGTIMGAFQMKGDHGPRAVVVLKTGNVLKATDAETKEESKEFPVGTMLGVSLNYGLRELSLYKTGTRVWFKNLQEKKLPGGRKLWQYEFRVGRNSQKKSADDFAAEAQLSLAAGATTDLSDDMPF